MLDYQMRVLHGDCMDCSILAHNLAQDKRQTRYREMNDGCGKYHMAARFPFIPTVDMPCSPKRRSYEFMEQMLTSRQAQRNLIGITSTDIVQVGF